MEKRVIELALEALEKRKAAIEEEIAQIRGQLTGSPRAARAAVKAAQPRKRGPRSRAARRAQSERMRAYWAKRRAEAAKEENAGKKKT